MEVTREVTRETLADPLTDTKNNTTPATITLSKMPSRNIRYPNPLACPLAKDLFFEDPRKIALLWLQSPLSHLRLPNPLGPSFLR